MSDPLGAPLTQPLYQRLAIIGLGLIGSSIVRAARRMNLAVIIAGADSSPGVCARMRELGVADEVWACPAQAVRNADLTILCVPVGANESIIKEIAPVLKPASTLSDVGSVKCAVIDAIKPLLPPHVYFIPAHPVAGTEYSGPDAGFASVFVNRWCIFTPEADLPPGVLETYERFWTAMGANVELMSPSHHDHVLAITSHLPHILAFNIVGTASDYEKVTQSEVVKFSAGGFRDLTRIAASDPTMWRDVFLNNKPAVLEILGRFTEDLIALQRMIRWEDGEGLYDLFNRNRSIRRRIIESGQETAATDFGRIPDAPAAAEITPPNPQQPHPEQETPRR